MRPTRPTAATSVCSFTVDHNAPRSGTTVAGGAYRNRGAFLTAGAVATAQLRATPNCELALETLGCLEQPGTKTSLFVT